MTWVASHPPGGQSEKEWRDLVAWLALIALAAFALSSCHKSKSVIAGVYEVDLATSHGANGAKFSKRSAEPLNFTLTKEGTYSSKYLGNGTWRVRDEYLEVRLDQPRKLLEGFLTGRALKGATDISLRIIDQNHLSWDLGSRGLIIYGRTGQIPQR